MKRQTQKEKMEFLREKLKNNPRALAELDYWDYESKSDWWLKKLEKEAGINARIKKYFLR
jgi:hypothetical protein